MKTNIEISRSINEDRAIERETRYKIAEFLRNLAYYIDPKDVKIIHPEDRTKHDMCYAELGMCCMLLKGHRGRHRV